MEDMPGSGLESPLHRAIHSSSGRAWIAFLTLGKKVPFCDFHIKNSASAF